jgi:hypothetical protein
VFPVRYELNSYILLRRNSVFKRINGATVIPFLNIRTAAMMKYFKIVFCELNKIFHWHNVSCVQLLSRTPQNSIIHGNHTRPRHAECRPHTQYNTTQYNTTQHNTTQHNTTQHLFSHTITRLSTKPKETSSAANMAYQSKEIT